MRPLDHNALRDFVHWLAEMAADEVAQSGVVAEQGKNYDTKKPSPRARHAAPARRGR